MSSSSDLDIEAGWVILNLSNDKPLMKILPKILSGQFQVWLESTNNQTKKQITSLKR